MTSTTGRTLTITEASERLSRSVRTLRRWVNEGDLRPVEGRQRGKALKFLESEVEQAACLLEEGMQPREVRPDQVLAACRNVIRHCQRLKEQASRAEELLLDKIEDLHRLTGDREVYAYLLEEGRNPRRQARIGVSTKASVVGQSMQ